MKIFLFDFQKQALHALRIRLVDARRGASPDNPKAITLSAPTGSGKTVILTALFEAILDAPDDQLEWPSDWVPQHDAVILWVSDMPELNEQTRRKIELQSDKVCWARQLIIIDQHFDQERLDGGRIYFINTQKLANDRLLTTVADGRHYSLWTTLTNTARAIPDRFYVVIDEAHRGMSGGQAASRARSIVQRFLLGHQESGLVKMPLVIGVSATPQRFDDLLSSTNHARFPVKVPPEDVRKSGLLKERILIHHPETTIRAELGLLEEAVRRWEAMTESWKKYCTDEGERVINPILVVQVEDGTGGQTTRTDLQAAIAGIEAAIGRPLRDSEFAHAFQDSANIIVGNRAIRKIEPSRIDDDREVAVVFFKMALSTGWDCPRAEIMMSFRRAQDHTYIAQLLGRMVRTPLARRVERLAELNDVHLYLPHFDKKAVANVIKALENSEDVPPTEAGEGSELVVLKRRDGTEPIFEAMKGLVTYKVNAHRAQSDIRRYQALARRLTIDGIDDDVWEEAKSKAITWISQEVAGIKTASQFDEKFRQLTTLTLRSVAVRAGTNHAVLEEKYEIEASDLDLDRHFEEIGRSLGNGLHQEYWKAHAERDASEVKAEVIIVGRTPQSISSLERKSLAAFNELYDRFRAKLRGLPEQKKSAYDRLRLASTTPTTVLWELQDTIDFRRMPTDFVWSKHLYVEDDGTFRTALGSWESGVLNEELAKAGVVGWLRNVDRKPWSLEIPYEVGGIAKPMFPDLVIVRETGRDYSFDVLEPHDPSLADNVDKAKGLAQFTEKHGDLFGRIQLIRGLRNTDGSLRFQRLEMNKAAIRDAVRNITNNAQLDKIFEQQSEH